MISWKKKQRRGSIRLLEECPYEKITISRICLEAHISRQAFYIYYHSKDEVIKEVYINVLEKTYLDPSYKIPSDDFIDHVIHIYDSHSHMFIALEKWYVIDYLSKENQRIIENLSTKSFEDPYIQKYSQYYLASILAPLHYMLMHWLYNNKKETKEELKIIIKKFIYHQ